MPTNEERLPLFDDLVNHAADGAVKALKDRLDIMMTTEYASTQVLALAYLEATCRISAAAMAAIGALANVNPRDRHDPTFEELARVAALAIFRRNTHRVYGGSSWAQTFDWAQTEYTRYWGQPSTVLAALIEQCEASIERRRSREHG